MTQGFEDRKKMRAALQKELDARKTQKERNEMGQFATPDALAFDIMQYAKTYCQDHPTSFIEPSIGLGAFYAAFQKVFGAQAGYALGYELDKEFYLSACKLWEGCDITLRNEDFLKATPPSKKFQLLVANPPYVRHHHIEASVKKCLQQEILHRTGINISGLAGLYCYFMMLSAIWLEEEGLSCWLVPAEFMDVNYGKAVKQYLLEKVDLISIHRFEADDVQFDDALVSSSVVLFRNAQPSSHEIQFTSGSTLTHPSNIRKMSRASLKAESKWSLHFKSETVAIAATDEDCRLGNFFSVKRGIATGGNDFFIIDEETVRQYEIPGIFLKPILPSPRYVSNDVIATDAQGNADLQQKLYLFSCNWSKVALENKYPGVLRYIAIGEQNRVDQGYICSRRTPWYACEERKPAPIVVPYMGRSATAHRMFRFILNQSDALSTNVYLLLYPRQNYASCLRDPNTMSEVWSALNHVSKDIIAANGREYGGGLHKIEPQELLNVPVPEVASILLPKRSIRELTLF